MKTKTMYDILHEAEKQIRRDGITNLNYITNIQLNPIAATTAPTKAIEAAVTKYSINVYNTYDIKLDYHLPPDRIFLHDVHANLSYLFMGVRTDVSNILIQSNADELIKRLRRLRSSLEMEITVSTAPNMRGAALHRLLRLGKDYLTILDLFYAINAISLGSSDAHKLEIARAVLQDGETEGEGGTYRLIKAMLAVARMIPAEIISQSVSLYNMLTGTATTRLETSDDVIDYAAAIRLLFAKDPADNKF